jgi:hypothetical protein
MFKHCLLEPIGYILPAEAENSTGNLPVWQKQPDSHQAASSSTGAVQATTPTHENLEKSNVMRTLVISPNWIGEAVMAQPLLQALKECPPERSIDVLAPACVAPVWRAIAEVGTVVKRYRVAVGRTVLRRTRSGRLKFVQVARFLIKRPAALRRLPTKCYTSVCSAISSASSTSMPR